MLIQFPSTSQLVARGRADVTPVDTLLARLGPGSRRAFRVALNGISRFISDGTIELEAAENKMVSGGPEPGARNTMPIHATRSRRVHDDLSVVIKLGRIGGNAGELSTISSTVLIPSTTDGFATR